MNLEDITDIVVGAFEAQCNEDGAPRLMMVETDDMSSVSLEGSFDLRSVAAYIISNWPKELADILAKDNSPGRVEYGEDGGLRITIAPGALRTIG